MDEKKLSEIAKSIYDCMTDEQKAKAAKCGTDEEFSAYLNSLELELSDEAAEAVAGGIQAGPVLKKIGYYCREEFILPEKPKDTISDHEIRRRQAL